MSIIPHSLASSSYISSRWFKLSPGCITARFPIFKVSTPAQCRSQWSQAHSHPSWVLAHHSTFPASAGRKPSWVHGKVGNLFTIHPIETTRCHQRSPLTACLNPLAPRQPCMCCFCRMNIALFRDVEAQSIEWGENGKVETARGRFLGTGKNVMMRYIRRAWKAAIKVSGP